MNCMIFKSHSSCCIPVSEFLGSICTTNNNKMNRPVRATILFQHTSEWTGTRHCSIIDVCRSDAPSWIGLQLLCKIPKHPYTSSEKFRCLLKSGEQRELDGLTCDKWVSTQRRPWPLQTASFGNARTFTLGNTP